MAKQKNNKTTTSTGVRMWNKTAKADAAARKLADLATAKGIDLDKAEDCTLALAWAAGTAAEVFKSTDALPLLTASQATAYATEHPTASVYVLGKSLAMVVLPDGIEVRRYKGQSLPVTDIPDEAYADLPRLRRTRRIKDARARVLASVSTMIAKAGRLMKADAKAAKKQAAPADAPATVPAEKAAD